MKLNALKIWPMLILLLCGCYISAAQQRNSADTILQRYAADTLSKQHPQPLYLVKFKTIPAESILQLSGLVQSITRYHYIVRQRPADSIIAYVYPANNNYKAGVQLLRQIEKARDNDSIMIQASFTPGEKPPAFAGILFYSSRYAVAKVKVKKQDWPAFISQPAILLADVIRRPSPEIIINTSNLSVNRINIAQQRFPLIRGKSVTVSVKEDRFDTTDIDLLDRYIPSSYASALSSSHALIMATLIGGAGNSGANGTGAAPGVWLSSADFNSSLFPDDDAYYTQSRITVQNHSYGTGIENYYGAEAAAYDQQILDADTIIHVYSSGNIGTQAAAGGRYQGIAGYANLSGNFKQAKNIITVGGTDGASTVMSLSSRGPAYDGRIKPEIAAYGEDGTSGAAALTSGVAALLQDAWRQRYNSAAPAALIKAVIINSAIRPQGVLPGYDHGYGYLHALGALQTIQANRTLRSEVSAGGTTAFDISIPAGIQQVKVTLCWNDPPAAVNAVKALVNDLDLQAVTAVNQHYLPWVLSNYPAADSLARTAVRGRDSINNTEQVSIDRPAAGKLHITVQGKQLATSTQTFYLAYEFTPLQSFEWQNPAPESILGAAQNIPLQWQTTYSGNGDLSYSTDSGSTWLPIVQQIQVQQGLYNWTTPNIFRKVLLKLTLADTSFISPPCYISPMLTMHTGFNCKDTVLFYWNAQPGAAAYQLYTLNAGSITTYSQPRDTFIFVPKSAASSLYFAVSPLATAGWAGARSYTINYTQQGVSCYVENLLADKTTDKQVLLSLTLGSNYRLANLYWERLSHNNWITLQTQQGVPSLNFNYLDETPPDGIVYYRVRLETVDGNSIYSDPVSVEILRQNSILIFPNPAVTQLNILDEQVRSRKAVITDMTGRIVLQRNLEDTREIIPLQQLANGMYNCSIYLEGKRIFSAQFIKQE